MHITLKQLQIFETVAAQQSYTEAAKLLYLTQPAVSMQIKQLEEQTGLPLFDRLGKQISLTHAGEELLQYAKNIQLQLDEAEQVMQEMKGLKRGRLHLTMASTANYFTPQLLAAFHQLYPDAKVQLDVTNRSGLINAVRNNTTDMAIMGRPPLGTDLVGIPFMENPLVIIAPPTHPLAGREMIRLKELAQEPFIVREGESGTRIAAERFFAEHGIKLVTGMEMNRSEAIKQAVMAELGLGIVSLHTIDMELALKRLTVLNVEDFPIMRHWHIVHRNGKRFAAIPEAFRQFVLEQATELIKPPAY
ncbi:MAG: LysR family transcriptional regulator [Zetaproteobacteria bacterium CG06_land_8_20_14_3_00_59_53]|nr:MAG: LysR family transcriptional regulator [Zetaproteobacteria bacterium CG2_30_59_37]PIO89979.1 MAG: LysR family transcriptional regulator [Zetaproteobacteria bacterium CG23_combo_of_CG06-09_8_20_14_all_59_86]PIQ64086.1 MAG: LysR family transcriptional regulator [Zetaproteobacteria bacterium CG11_big_fil_rev_8_21_14_0_20_59_439]PIU69910.1 MAG: LysR family transcriptional regulator [Zetaproteobacteria bacterium CG06_land_8_20_14_3_00_59_53]PIU97584.1 MAG: LysR family transcriptional regulato